MIRLYIEYSLAAFRADVTSHRLYQKSSSLKYNILAISLLI